jgi:prephenate dehydratase
MGQPESPPKSQPKNQVAYQGEPGAYSERAVRSLFPDAEPMPCETVRLVFSRVTSGEAEFGVVPLENSQAGSVNETYDLLQHTSLLRVVGEVLVRVDHALLGVPGARLEGIRRAHSHWQALAQCEEFLASMHIEPVAVHDTAGAARMIAESPSVEDAAIASVQAGALVGLAVLAERIQTEKENLTKFAAIGTRDPVLGVADKTSLIMAVLDEPGSLLASLQPFAERDINLHKLESRPRRGKAFEYVFYVDLMAAADDPQVEDALGEVARHTSLLRVLGSYRAATEPV